MDKPNWYFCAIHLFHLFSSFQTNTTFFTTIYMKKCPSSLRCWDLNPQPSAHESPPITTRPGLPLSILRHHVLILSTPSKLSCTIFWGKKCFFKWAISFSLFSSYQYTVVSKQMFNINKFLPMTGFQLVLEATALPTEPQPLPRGKEVNLAFHLLYWRSPVSTFLNCDIWDLIVKVLFEKNNKK